MPNICGYPVVDAIKPTDLQRQIICARFGAKSDKKPTLARLGAIHGLSRERIHQLEKRALRRLRTMFDKVCS